MLEVYDQISVDVEKVEKLMALLTNYYKRTYQTFRSNKNDVQVISSDENDDVEEMTISISTGPKPKFIKEHVVSSPNGKFRLRVTRWRDRKLASTYITVEFSKASGIVFGINGKCPDVKAWWKDNTTIVIETNENYRASIQHTQVRSDVNVINIEYILQAPN